MSAVVAGPATYVGAHNHAVPNLQRRAFEITILIAADGSDASNILVALNDREGNLFSGICPAVLRRVALERMFVSSANPRNLHSH